MGRFDAEDQTQTLANYLPGGRAFGAKNVAGSVLRLFLEGLSVEVVRDTAAIELIRTGTIPDSINFFIDEWESAVGIPDDCFSGGGSFTERVRDIGVKLASLGVQTAEDFVNLAALLDVNVEVTSLNEGTGFPYEFPFEFELSDRETKFTIVVNFLDLPAPLLFPYQFPLPFGSPETAQVKCLFDKLKPANCDVLYTNL